MVSARAFRLVGFGLLVGNAGFLRGAMEDTNQSASTRDGARETGESLAPSMGGERERWLDAMADMQLQADRRFESHSIRIARLERSSGVAIPEEMKGFLLMLGLYIGVQLLLPFVVETVARWRSQS